jgi:hypothetical protein
MLQAAEDEDRELELKVKAKREAQQFKEQLLLLMQKEAEDNSARDELILQADAKFAAKREADEKRVLAQRQALLDEVMDTRAAQVTAHALTLNPLREESARAEAGAAG